MELRKSYEGAVPREIHHGSYGYRVLRDVLTCGELRYTTLRLYARDGVAVKNVQKAVNRLIEKGLLKIVGACNTKALRYVYNLDNNSLVTALYGVGILDRLMSATNDLHYTTSSRTYQDKQQRRWRMGEVCAMLDSAGCPLWQSGAPPNGLVAYSSTEIRQSCGDVNLAANSRIAAELVSEEAAYAVYSIGPTLQRWNKEAERRGRRAAEIAAIQDGDSPNVNNAICFYSKAAIPAEYIRGHSRIKGTVKHKCIGIHNTADVYRQFHLLPLNAHGKHMLQLLCIPNLNDILCDMFNLISNKFGYVSVPCHGYNDDIAMFFAITGEMNLLYYFLTWGSTERTRELVCWDWQAEMLEKFVEENELDIRIWYYEERELMEEIQRRLSPWQN